jgi:hypothetical protein
MHFVALLLIAAVVITAAMIALALVLFLATRGRRGPDDE